MIRAFLAVELGRDILERYAAFHASEAPRHRELRWVRPENLHLTIRFLGDTAEGRIEPLQSEVESAVAGIAPFRLSVGAPGCFGPRGAPSVLWFSVDEGGPLADLARAVDEAVRRRGFPPDDKPWRAHLTVARNPARKRFEGWEETLRGAGIAGLSTECREVVLFSSRLGSGGPTYAPMFQASLRGPVP